MEYIPTRPHVCPKCGQDPIVDTFQSGKNYVCYVKCPRMFCHMSTRCEKPKLSSAIQSAYMDWNLLCKRMDIYNKIGSHKNTNE